MSKPIIDENTLKYGHLQAVIWQNQDEAVEPALILRTYSVGVIGLMHIDRLGAETVSFDHLRGRSITRKPEKEAK